MGVSPLPDRLFNNPRSLTLPGMDMKLPPVLFVALLGFALSSHSYAQTDAAKDSLPPVPAGKEWKLIWQDEFNGTNLDETKWNRLGDWKRRDGFWVKEDAYQIGRAHV